MNSVLMIDDDVKLGSMLREFLDRHKIRLDTCHEAAPGLEAANRGNYDLLLLDVMLPGVDGFEVLRRLRTYSQLSVLLLSARGEAADRIHGLELGADDYLPKPFDPNELVARIRAIWRRTVESSSSRHANVTEHRLSLGKLVVDMRGRTASYEHLPLDLTTIEFSLLEAFLQFPAVVLTREELVDRIFGRPFHPLNRNLDMHVCRLRRKLHSARLPANLIKTVRSSGYLFSPAELER